MSNTMNTINEKSKSNNLVIAEKISIHTNITKQCDKMIEILKNRQLSNVNKRDNA